MKTFVRWGFAAASLGVGAGALWRWMSRAADGVGDKGAGSRWLSVTVNLPLDEVVSDERLPEPLARLGDAIRMSALNYARGPAAGGPTFASMQLAWRRTAAASAPNRPADRRPRGNSRLPQGRVGV